MPRENKLDLAATASYGLRMPPTSSAGSTLSALDFCALSEPYFPSPSAQALFGLGFSSTMETFGT